MKTLTIVACPLDTAIRDSFGLRRLFEPALWTHYPGDAWLRVGERLRQVSHDSDRADWHYMRRLAVIAERSGQRTVSILFTLRRHVDAVFH